MAAPGTFERVYATLKRRLRAGDFRPGERLEPAQLSEQLNASVTPVRDALHRLTGERLVDAPPHEGFRAPALSETLLRQLYAWHLDLLLLALSRRALASEKLDLQPGETTATPVLEMLVGALGAAGINPELVYAISAARNRLAPFDAIERRLLAELEQEHEQIIGAAQRQDWRALRKALVHYHRRRSRLVPEILLAAQSCGVGGYNPDISGL